MYEFFFLLLKLFISLIYRKLTHADTLKIGWIGLKTVKLILKVSVTLKNAEHELTYVKLREWDERKGEEQFSYIVQVFFFLTN